jgi:hypothetical protein
VTENSKTTDLLEVDDLVEYSAELGLLSSKPTSAQRPSVAENSNPSAVAETRTGRWPPTDADPNVWSSRIVRLSTKALKEELDLSPENAAALCQALFEKRFPELWKEFEAITQSPGSGKTMDVKLFDELFRYYVIYAYGSPAKAARELGMKDNALREFIYSREQRRMPGSE